MLQLEGLPSEPEIRQLVEAFYSKVRDDDLIGPVFAARIQDWSIHLDRMTAFWTTVLLAKPGFVGDPVGKHRAITEIRPEHYDRWLELFEATVNELFDANLAANIYGRATRMRVALERPTVKL